MTTRRRRGLANWLTESDTPLFVLDRQGNLLFFNHGCQVLTGWSPADVVGKVCRYARPVAAEEADSLTGALGPPPEVLDGEPLACRTHLVRRNGVRFDCTIQYIPLRAAEPRDRRILGVILPAASAWPVSTAAPQKLHDELARFRSEARGAGTLDDLIAVSPTMQRVSLQTKLAIGSSVPVHLSGERGTGRRWLARCIHAAGAGPRADLLILDCQSSSAADLKRSIHRVVEFLTDAHAAGVKGASLLLHEVSRVPRDLQRDLLARFRGRDAALNRIRLFTSSSEPLVAGIEDERLLPEFVAFVTPLVIELPPLRDRLEDLQLLGQLFLEEVNHSQDRQIGGLTQEVWEEFSKYRWPGNAGELKTVIQEAHAGARGSLITASDLPFRFRTGVDAQQVGQPEEPDPIDLQALVDQFERDHILDVLRQTKDNKSRAAELLGLTRARLYRKLEQLGIG